jgi:hypothetical protein
MVQHAEGVPALQARSKETAQQSACQAMQLVRGQGMALVYHAQGAGAVGGPAHKHSTAQHIRPSLPARAPRPQPKVSASNPRPLNLSLRLSLAFSKTLLHLWAPSFPTTNLQPYIPMPPPSIP